MQFQFVQNKLTERIKQFSLTALDFTDERALTGIARVFALGGLVKIECRGEAVEHTFTVVLGTPPREEGNASS
jgi:hypothetical protein